VASEPLLFAISALYFLGVLCVEKENAFHAESANFFRKGGKEKALRALIIRGKSASICGRFF
jgi:hypothetical protein